MYLCTVIISFNIIGDYYTCSKYFVIMLESYVYCFNTHFVLPLLAFFLLMFLSTLLGLTSVGEVFLLLINTTFLLYVTSF